MPRIGTPPLAGSAAWGSPFHARPQAIAAPLAVRRRGTTGSHVPHRSPDQARATSMPDTTWPIIRHPPGSSRARTPRPVSMPPICFRRVLSVRSRSPSWPTPDALTGAPSPRRSAPRLLTGAPRGGLRPPPAGRPRRPTSRSAGPSISDAAPHHQSGLLQPDLLCVRGTRVRTYFRLARSADPCGIALASLRPASVGQRQQRWSPALSRPVAPRGSLRKASGTRRRWPHRRRTCRTGCRPWSRGL